jgi:hypothetical protein
MVATHTPSCQALGLAPTSFSERVGVSTALLNMDDADLSDFGCLTAARADNSWMPGPRPGMTAWGELPEDSEPNSQGQALA